MVKLCHRGEDMLNEARSGRVRLDAGHVDALLNTLDCLQQMLASLRAGEAIAPAPAALLDRLLTQRPSSTTAEVMQLRAHPVADDSTAAEAPGDTMDRKSTRLNASH